MRRVHILAAIITTLYIFTFPTLCHEAMNDSDIYLYETDEIQIPFELVDNRVVITLEHDALGPLKMLIDTGATTSVLFRKHTLLDTPLETSGFKRVHFPAFNVKSFGEKIELLPVKRANWYYSLRNVAYIHIPETIENNTITLFDGIIGRQLFEDYTVGVNIDTQTLVLTSKDIDIHTRYERSIPLDLKTQTPFIKVSALFPWETLSSKKQLMVDTGYPGTMVIWGQKHYRNATSSTEYLYYRKRNVGFKMDTTFRFGGNKFRKIPTYIQSDSPYYSNKREGIIGGAILNNYNYAFDYARQKLYLRPSINPIDRSKLIAYPPNNSLFIKKRFDKNSSDRIGLVVIKNRQ
jgi:hypothetical protein